MTDSPEPTLAAAPPPIDPPPVDPPAAAPVIVDSPAPGRAAVTVTRQSRQVIVHGVGFLPTEALIVTVKSADGENWTPFSANAEGEFSIYGNATEDEEPGVSVTRPGGAVVLP